MNDLWLVTGATSDIAQAVLNHLAPGRGFVLAGRDAAALETLSERLLSRGAVSAVVVVHDFAEAEDQWLACYAHLVETYGRPDHLLLAQGQLLDSVQAEADGNALMRMLRVNLTSAAQILRAHAAHRRDDVFQTVVLSSVAGDRARPSNCAYGASKAALNYLVDGLSLQHPASRCLTVRLGPVRTRMTAHLPAGPLLADLPAVASRISRLISGQRQGTVYVPGRWRWIMQVVRLLPRALLARLAL
jgi:NAD(P)-dependent dehydrogenase (short-subunit alcohol dehydrogenase family)